MDDTNSTKFVVIGHVDTGKSTLCGHLLYKLGQVTDHEMAEIKKDAEKDKMSRWCWARVLDCWQEEQRKGKTHEHHKITFQTPEQSYVLIDTPGHAQFVRQMIEGLHDVDIAVLIVSAIEGEFTSSFDKGMLKEHLILTHFKGIRHLVVVVNKMDQVNWSKDSYQAILKKVNRFLKYIRWKKDYIKYLAISAWDGIGLVNTTGLPEWAPQTSLLETLSSIATSKKPLLTNKVEDIREANVLLVKFRILETHIPITAGYQAIIHHDNKECDFVIERLIDKRFVMSGETVNGIIELPHKIHCYKNQRLIVRREMTTVGLAIIEGRRLKE